MVAKNWQAPQESLSKRSVEILRLLAAGMSDREIAEHLVMTVNTIKWYNRQIYSTLGVGSRTQAIARARDLQLLDQDDGPHATFQAVHSPPKHNLPVETTHFIGRRHEMEAITAPAGYNAPADAGGTPGNRQNPPGAPGGREHAGGFQ